MADYSRIQHILMGQIQKVAATRQVQGLAYGVECVRRTLVDYRETGTPKVFPLTAGSASTFITVEGASAVRLFGVLIENTDASLKWVQLYNNAAPTIGTTVPIQTVSCPATAARFVAYAVPEDQIVTAFTFAVTTTAAGATQTNGNLVNVALVYTK